MLSNAPIFRSTFFSLPVLMIQFTFDYFPLITSANSNLLSGIYHRIFLKKNQLGTVTWFLNSISFQLMTNLIVSIFCELWCVIVTCWWVQKWVKITLQWFMLNFGYILLFITLFIAFVCLWLFDSIADDFFDYLNWWLEC